MGFLEQLSTYRGTQSDVHTHAHDLPPQMGGCWADGNESQQRMAHAVDSGAGLDELERRWTPSGNSVSAQERALERGLRLHADDARQLPRLMHWFGWYSAMALNRLSGRCGHFWEARYYATAIAPKDHRRVLNTLRYIHANPKAAGVRKGFYDPYSNYGHYGRLACDGISEWHPSFLQLASSLKGCSRRYERFCHKYRHHAKGVAKCHWGSRMLKRLVEARGGRRSKRKRVSPGQQQLPFAFDVRLNQIPEEWHQVAVRFRKANGIRDSNRERSIWQVR